MSDMGHMSDAVTVAVVGGVAAVISTVVAYFGGKGSAAAQLQEALNKGMRETLLRADKRERECDHKIAQLVGEINGLKQYHVSLVNALHRAGVDVPKYRPVEVVFLPLEEALPEEEVDA